MFVSLSRITDVERADADGLKEAIFHIYAKVCDITPEQVKLDKCGVVGGGADGASVNFGHVRGLMVLVKEKCPWLVAVPCVAHRLELAAKDAFKGTFFTNVSISVNKCRLIEHLMLCFSFSILS